MSMQSFRIVTGVSIVFLCSIVASDLHAASTGVGYSTKAEDLNVDREGYSEVYYYKSPTYNGVKINDNINTVLQYGLLAVSRGLREVN